MNSQQLPLQNNHNATIYSGVISVLLGAFLLSFSAVMVKLTTVPATTSAFYRMLFGAAGLFLFAIIRREKLWSSSKALMYSAFAGILFSLDLVFWHRSIHYIGPGLATIIINFQVFFVTLLGITFYKEKVSRQFLLSIPVAILGLFLLLQDNWLNLGEHFRYGISIGVLAAIFYSLYFIPIRNSQGIDKPLSPLVNIAYVSLTSAIFLGLLTFFQGESFQIPDVHNLEYLLIYGFVCQALAWYFVGSGIPKLPLSLAGLLLLLQPTLSFIWDIVIFHRQTLDIEILGAVITFIAIYLGSRKEIPRKVG